MCGNWGAFAVFEEERGGHCGWRGVVGEEEVRDEPEKQRGPRRTLTFKTIESC